MKLSCRILALFFALALLAGPAWASYRLPPYKDGLFRYPGLLSGQLGDPFIIVDYDKRRDIHRRDKEWERRVHGEYVSTYPGRSQEDDTLEANGRSIRHIRVGKEAGANAIVIYVHGQGGNRFQGANDWSFGGNFNRIKNLMARNGGLYISPDFTDFGDKGAADIAALMRHYKARSPGAPVFVACGSMGSFLCWQLARNPDTAALMGGMLLMGSAWDESFLSTKVFRSQKLPIYFGHGSWDNVYDWQKQAAFFTRIKQVAPKYPAKFVLFETGTHGTPIRMTDWRLILNWMLEVGGY
ncbi:alpha/beta hydrolase [Stappia sp. F7233]|uniref:Alpha/beta hydrolase n=1 Tax=Stappia albiluteola TaxID=2758565 RepID=A0A839ADS1_9HYPH|nr:alpha/beta hydrolase [Stappia albiluteola]MBA5777833.1 alpha/beta hydrolase [Stappia albiluteola]